MSKVSKSIYLLFFSLFAIFLTACSSIAPPNQPHYDSDGFLEPSKSIGQTFVVEFDGLDSIDIFIKEISSPGGTIHLALFNDPAKTSPPLGNASIILSDPVITGFHRFSIPVQPNSNNQYYYLELTLDDTGVAQIGSSDGGSYINGSMYVNDVPVDGQLTFQLNYNPSTALIGFLGEVLGWVGIILISIFTFLLPGWSLSDALLPGWTNQSFWVKLALSIGIGLSLYPVLLLWASLFGLSLGPVYAWLPGTIAILYLSWKFISGIRRLPPAEREQSLSIKALLSKPRQVKLVDWVVIFSLAVIIFSRFFPIRNLDVPMWGDSYQHTMITQLLADNSGLFEQWLPYTPLTTFTYHFGFHSLATAFFWITGFSAANSVLWTGQIVNVLAIFCLYPLAIRISSNKWAGAIAIISAGLLLPMPMTYVNWGRYTQLAALVILPVAIYIIWEIYEKGAIKTKGYVLAWFLLSGLALTHYRILLFAILFFPAFILIYGSKFGFKNLIKQTVIICAVAGALFLPWFIRVFGGQIMGIFFNQLSTPANQTSSVAHQTNAIGDLLTYLPLGIWITLPIIILWGLWRKDRGIILLLLWWFMILLAANPQWLGLPGTGAITNFAVFISLYIPTSLILGAGFSWVQGRFSRVNGKHTVVDHLPLQPHSKSNPIISVSTIIVLIIICLWGVGQRLADVGPIQYALVSRPDLRAFEWIMSNTTSNTQFLVNSFSAFGGYAIAGSDGGWWMPLLSGRLTNLPPLNYSFEQGTWPGYRDWVNELTLELVDKGVDDPGVLAMLSERGISHVYIGQRGGTVGYDGPLILDPNALLNSEYYSPLYHVDRVWIFEILANQ